LVTTSAHSITVSLIVTIRRYTTSNCDDLVDRSVGGRIFAIWLLSVTVGHIMMNVDVTGCQHGNR
jgi:hypothetical protein